MAPLLLFGFVFWVHLFQFSERLTWDAPVYVLIGKWIGQGLLPYRDLWEVKPPGIFYYLAAVFSILPEALWSIRVADFLFFVFGGAAFYRLCRNEANPVIALAGGALWVYYAHHPAFNVGGVYTEEYGSICSTGAMAAAAAYHFNGRSRHVVLSGTAASAAILFKHPFGAVLVPALILIAGRRSPRAQCAFLLAVATPILLFTAYFWSQSALSAFFDANVRAALAHVGVGQDGLATRWNSVVQTGLQTWTVLDKHPVLGGWLGWGLAICIVRPNRLRLAAVAWFLMDLIGIGVQKHFYGHHFIQMFPSACLLGTLGTAWLLQPRAAERRVFVALRLTLAAVLLGVTWPALQAVYAERRATVLEQWSVLQAGPRGWRTDLGGDLEREIGDSLRQRTKAHERIHVHDWGPTPQNIYWVADRLPASRHFFPFQLMTVGGLDAQALEDLDRTMPPYVVVARTNPHFIYFDSWLAQNYAKDARRASMEIWRRLRFDSFTSGSLVGLMSQPSSGGLGLTGTQSASNERTEKLAQPRRGFWRSPVVEVLDDEEVQVDCGPRRDVAENVRGVGLPRAWASSTWGEDDVRTLLGYPTKRGIWTSGRRDAQTVTMDLGFGAIVDRVIVTPSADSDDPSLPADSWYAIDASPSAPHSTSGSGDLAPLAGAWENDPDGARVYRFPAQVIRSLRLTATPDEQGRGYTLRRVRVAASGMGVSVRYRSAPTPVLEGSPWIAVEELYAPAWVPVEGYVQIECELWSEYATHGPLLRHARIGSAFFQGTGHDPAAGQRGSGRPGDPPDLAAAGAAHP